MSDLYSRLLAAVQAHKALADVAAGEMDGVWTQPDPDRRPGRIEDANGDVITYDEGSPGDFDAAHIVANDPAHVIRACERDLKVLQRHRPYWFDLGGRHCSVCGFHVDPELAWPCVEVADMAPVYGIEVTP